MTDTTYLGELHELIDRYFSLGEVRTLCFVLGIEYDSIPGEGKSARIWELLFYLARRDRLLELVAQAKRERPTVAWPPVPDDLALAASVMPREKVPSAETTSSDTHINIDIGGINRDMQGVIAAGDVKDVVISIGGQTISAAKKPSLEEFRHLLTGIQREIEGIVKQQDILAMVDPAAPFIAQGAEQSVNAVAERVQPEMEAEEAESMQKSLTTALNLLTGILDGARALAKKTDEVGEAVSPIIEKLESLVNKLGIAALWTAKLWLVN